MAPNEAAAQITDSMKNIEHFPTLIARKLDPAYPGYARLRREVEIIESWIDNQRIVTAVLGGGVPTYEPKPEAP